MVIFPSDSFLNHLSWLRVFEMFLFNKSLKSLIDKLLTSFNPLTFLIVSFSFFKQ